MRNVNVPLQKGKLPLLGLFVFVALPSAKAHAQATPQEAADQSAQPAEVAPPSEPPAAEPAKAEVPPPPAEPPAPPPAPDLFSRQAYEIPKNDWKATIYGFVEFDAIHDTTRSFDAESEGNGVIARTDAYSYHQQRTQFTARNSRLGVKVEAPRFEGIKPSATLEFDFMATAAGYGGPLASSQQKFEKGASNLSESSFFNNGIFRMRQAWMKLESDYVDLLAGQTYYLFGNQPYFFPCTVEYLGLPSMIFGRTPQIRLSHAFKSDFITVDVAVGAMRPQQRDSNFPDGQASVNFMFNGWKGIHTPGSGGTKADALAIGLSGAARRFKVDNLAQGPNTFTTANGFGVAADVLLPIVPVKDSKDRGNALTLNGEFTWGRGYSDLLGGLTGMNTGGGQLRIWPDVVGLGQDAQAVYPADVDYGPVFYSHYGVLRTIEWMTAVAGLQYYLPPSGRAFISVNGTYAKTPNIIDPIDQFNIGNIFTKALYADANFFFDIVPSARLGLSYHIARQYRYNDAQLPQKPHHQRFMGTLLYFF